MALPPVAFPPHFEGWARWEASSGLLPWEEEVEVAAPIQAVIRTQDDFHIPSLGVAPRRHRIHSVRVRADQQR